MDKNKEPLNGTKTASDKAVRFLHDAAVRPQSTLREATASLGARVGNAASAVIGRFARQLGREPHPEPPPSMVTPPSLLGNVHEIIALDDNAVLRNLLITQCYSDLAIGLTRVLGGDNANWCAFATWASKTAGRFIRKDEVPAQLRRLVSSAGSSRPERDGGVSVMTPWSSDGPGLFDMPERVLDQVSDLIAQGNLKVFSELGPVFSRMIEIYAGVERPGPSHLEALLDPIRSGPSTEGGQGLLRSALTHYHNAILTDDADRRAELILLGNARVGLHEQVRLQPYIAGSLNAPIHCLVETTFGPAARLPEVLQSAVVEGFVRPAVEKLQTLWREVATKEMMTLRLPEEVLDLGVDLPLKAGEALHSPYLATIEDPELYALLAEYGAHDATTQGSGAEDWAHLPSRMRYILELFRSRQSCRRLLGLPFRPEQHAQILSGIVPPGDDL